MATAINIHFIPETEAATLLGFKPRTLRYKVQAKHRYKKQSPLPIRFTTAGKGYRYAQEDIEKYLLKTAS